MGCLHAPGSDPGSPESAPSGGGTPSTRVVVLCCDGLYQRWLVQQASQMFDLVGVELQHPPGPRPTGPPGPAEALPRSEGLAAADPGAAGPAAL
jgi:hypothetical protein